MKLITNVKIIEEDRLVDGEILFDENEILEVVEIDERRETSSRKIINRMKDERKSKGEFVEIDGGGLFATAGLIDVHVHLREPGFEYKEDIASGTLAAAAGGFTTIMAMPNVNPFPDNIETVTRYGALIDENSVVNTIPYVCITKTESGKELVDMEAMVKAGYRYFSDDGVGVQDDGIMQKAMMEAKRLGAIIVAHTEENSYRKPYSCINEGVKSRELNLVGIPNECEYVQLARDLKMACRTGAQYHCCHMSTKESVGLIRKYKEKGCNVSGEVTAHHLILTEMDVKDSNYKVNPPLRSIEDRETLIQGIIDGTIEIIANDHAPHSQKEKDRGLVFAPFGIVSLETAFPMLYTKLVKNNVISLGKLLRLMSENPAEKFGLKKRGKIEKGYHSDIVLIDLKKEFKIDKDRFFSKGKNTPFHGEKCFGKIKKTFVNGKLVFEEE